MPGIETDLRHVSQVAIAVSTNRPARSRFAVRQISLAEGNHETESSVRQIHIDADRDSAWGDSAAAGTATSAGLG